MFSRLIFRLCTTVLLMALVSTVASAQNANGSIQGTVTDASGAVAPGAAVELKNTGTAQTWSQIATERGAYNFVELPPGEYALKVALTGFAEWRGTLTLRVAQTAVVPVTLAPAAVSTSVVVTDVTPVINVQSAVITDVKDFHLISTMPLAQRDFRSLLNLTPGVVASSMAGQGAGYTRMNGIRGGAVEFTVDGMSVNERYTNDLQRTAQPLDTIMEFKTNAANASAEYAKPGTVEIATKSGTNQFHGSLWEMNQNTQYAAAGFQNTPADKLRRNEFGGNLGGPVWIPKLYKGTNRTFFFADAEGIVQHSNVRSQRYVVPMPNWKTGDFSDYFTDQGRPITIYDPNSTRFDAATGAYTRDPFPGNRIPANRINPVASKILSYVPDPNRNIAYYDGPNWERTTGLQTDDRALYTFKVDQVLGGGNLTGRYTYIDRSNLRPKYFLNDNTATEGGSNAVVAYVLPIRPNLINEARVGVQRFHSYRGPVPITPPITETLGLPTYTDTIAWPGIYYGDPWTPSGYFEGIDRDNPQDAPMLGTSWTDNLTWIRGAHELKFGFYAATSAVNTFERGQPGGSYSFSGGFTGLMDAAKVQQVGESSWSVINTGAGLADMLLGDVSEAYLSQYPTFYTRQKQFGGFVQDNWKIGRKLSLQAGLRYDYWTPFKDKRGSSTNLNLNEADPSVVYPGSGSVSDGGFSPAAAAAYVAAGLKLASASQAGMPLSLWSMKKTNFAPRLGFAYQIDSNTVVRGGYGVYYWAMPLVQYHQNTRKNPPFSPSYQSLTGPGQNWDQNGRTAGDLTFPAAPGQVAGARDLGTRLIDDNSLVISKPADGWRILPWNPDYHNQMAQQWNLTLERALPGKFGGRVSYIGNHGSHLEVYDPINWPAPSKLMPGVDITNRRKYPNYAASGTDTMDLLTFDGYSNANQLQFEIKRSFVDGLLFQAYYTYARVLGNSEGSFNTYGGLELPPASLTNNASLADRLSMIYANDGQMPRHTFSFNTIWALPLGKGHRLLATDNSILNRIVGGWEITGYYYWRSGLFFAPYFSSKGGKYQMVGDPVLPKDQRTVARWFDPSAFEQRADTLDWDLRNNVPRNFMTGPGYFKVDGSLVKHIPIRERVALRLDAQVFNLLNHFNYQLPGSSGRIDSSYDGGRIFQLQGRLEF